MDYSGLDYICVILQCSVLPLKHGIEFITGNVRICVWFLHVQVYVTLLNYNLRHQIAVLYTYGLFWASL